MVQEHRKHARFVAEQDGPNERLLKEKLAAAFLSEGFVGRAYLVQADLQDGTGINVVLALRASPPASPHDERQAAERFAAIFASIFHKHAHLDILFLKDHTEAEVRKVCPPFFARHGHADVRIN
jgi:hypothetical protein